MVSSSLVNILFVVALGLLLLVSGGVVYLTTAEWRDRRRQDRDKEYKGILIQLFLHLVKQRKLQGSWVSAFCMFDEPEFDVRPKAECLRTVFKRVSCNARVFGNTYLESGSLASRIAIA
jgi:hypothetical protein